MPIVIKIISRADVPYEIESNTYLESFNADSHGGRGEFAFTTDCNRAIKFKNMAEALVYWRTQSKLVPVRPDGKPNRPLTAFNVSLEEV